AVRRVGQVLGLALDTNGPEALLARREERRAAPGEGVEDEAAGRRHEATEPAHERQRLDGRMCRAVALGRRRPGRVEEARGAAGVAVYFWHRPLRPLAIAPVAPKATVFARGTRTTCAFSACLIHERRRVLVEDDVRGPAGR